MSWKKWKKKLKKALKKAAPKVTVGKDLGTKNLGKAASTATKAIGGAGSGLVESLGKGTEGIVANTADIGKSLAKGDFKGIGKEALELVQSGKDIAKGVASSNVGLASGLVGAVGSGIGDKNIQKGAKDIQRESQKGIDKYGDVAMDVGANVVTGGGYGAAKTATQSLASGGLGGLVSSKGLRDAALQAAGSYAGVDPNMLKMGMSASQGDLKGATLQGLGSFAGLSPDQMKIATTGAAALTGDKKGLASGLASQFGAGDTASDLIGSAAGGNVDFKKMALEKLGSSAGVSQDILKQVSTGKFDVGELAKNANLTASLGDSAKAYMPGSMQNFISQGEQVAGLARDQVKAIQDVQKAAESTYKIAKGDTLNAIAKKMGVDPKALAAANNIKDPNKIAAGMNLKIPSAVKQAVDTATGARKSITDKYLKDASGKTIYGPNNAPIPNPDYNQEEADKLAIQQQGGTGEEIILPEEPGFLDKAKDFFGGAKKIPGAISSGLSSAKKFAAENKAGIGLGADVLAAGAGYMAGEAARKEAKGLSEQQLKELQGAGAAFEKMQYDPTRYKKEREFIEQRIAGGGITPQEKLMQQQGDIRAARAGAAARLAGIEQQARMGRGATGSGSALAASLAGGQSVMGTQAETNLAREASASQRLEQDIQRQTNLARQQTAEEAQLAQEQGQFGLSRAQQTGSVRGDLGNLALGRAAALQNLAGQGAEMAKRGLSMMDTTDQQSQAQQPTSPQPQAQSPAPASASSAKVGGAKRLSQGTQQTNKPQQSQPQQPAAQKFNQQNMPQPGQGQGYGVLAPVTQAVQKGQQAVRQAQNTVDQAKQKAEELKKNPLGAFGIKF
jgi:LysM repeat protein